MIQLFYVILTCVNCHIMFEISINFKRKRICVRSCI